MKNRTRTPEQSEQIVRTIESNLRLSDKMGELCIEISQEEVRCQKDSPERSKLLESMRATVARMNKRLERNSREFLDGSSE